MTISFHPHVVIVIDPALKIEDMVSGDMAI